MLRLVGIRGVDDPHVCSFGVGYDVPDVTRDLLFVRREVDSSGVAGVK